MNQENSPTPDAPRRKRILFVCSLNQWRSPTAEMLYRDDPRLEVRSAGIRANAARRISARDLAWADVVMVMEREQKKWIQENFRDVPLPPILNLDITANLEYMDTGLQRLLRAAIDPEIEVLLSS
jgi:predicted protein tyrosine phosphatase